MVIPPYARETAESGEESAQTGASTMCKRECSDWCFHHVQERMLRLAIPPYAREHAEIGHHVCM